MGQNSAIKYKRQNKSAKLAETAMLPHTYREAEVLRTAAEMSDAGSDIAAS